MDWSLASHLDVCLIRNRVCREIYIHAYFKFDEVISCFIRLAYYPSKFITIPPEYEG
jgi:hypothetical protein